MSAEGPSPTRAGLLVLSYVPVLGLDCPAPVARPRGALARPQRPAAVRGGVRGGPRRDARRHPPAFDDLPLRRGDGDPLDDATSAIAILAIVMAVQGKRLMIPGVSAPCQPALAPKTDRRASLAGPILAALIGLAVGDCLKPAVASRSAPGWPSERSTSTARRFRRRSRARESCTAASSRRARPTGARPSRATARRADSRSPREGCCAAIRGRGAGGIRCLEAVSVSVSVAVSGKQ